MKTPGLHHITAIASDPQKNIDFYAKTLGLRFIKQTVNFDDPTTYHFYYADKIGSPGTVLTFFPWPGARRGQRGTGQAVSIGFSIPQKSLGFWMERFISLGIEYRGPQERFGEKYITIEDPDGLPLELIAAKPEYKTEPWLTQDVPVEQAIRAFHTTTLWEEDSGATLKLLKENLGYHEIAKEESLIRMQSSKNQPGPFIDVRDAQGFWRGTMGSGVIHHIAFRANNDAEQLTARDEIAATGLNITPQINRKYFRSVYFREPGGVLFEIATDGPGFAVDESVEKLGTTLQIPPQYESQAELIRKSLPPIKLPGETGTERAEAELGFIHRWIPNLKSKRVLLLLHGTGGDENDLVSLGLQLDPEASLLSPKGQVLENGMPRFFKRIAPGIFDEADLNDRTHQLAKFITQSSQHYSIDLESLIIVGYSNGANIALSLIFLYPELFRRALLFRPMLPFEPDRPPNLTKSEINLSLGIHDPAIPMENSDRLFRVLERTGAKLRVRWQNAGHAITPAEIEAAHVWIKGLNQ